MTRQFEISGESLVSVKGATGTLIASLTEWGLPQTEIHVTPHFKHEEIHVDAWGDAPVDIQFMLAEVIIRMDLIHVDPAIMFELIRLSMAGGSGVVGQDGGLPHAGTRLGGANARYSTGWNYFSMNIQAPQNNIPWNFPNCFLAEPPIDFPLGTKKSVFPVVIRCIPYTIDPWNGGAGASLTQIWSHVLDT